METRREYRRFPSGERCDDCNARRWYIENGRKYCENGHQVEGYVQFDVDVDDNFGNQGRVVRKKKDAREKQYKHLTGNEGRVLYLVCLQIILRKQIDWLVVHKGLDRELDEVCRGLWDLRIRRFIGLNPSASSDGKKKVDRGEGRKNANLSRASENETVYSSQGETPKTEQATTEEEDDEDDDDEYGYPIHRKRVGRVKVWSREDWDLPGAMDTLAVLYLGCLLRREAVRIGDIFRWAKNGQLPFLGAIELIPTELRERLPGWAQRTLLTRYVRFHGSELHKMVSTLMLGYQKNYGMLFPRMAPARLLLQYIKELALPPHVHKATQELCARLDLEFTFPTRRTQNDESLPSSTTFGELKPQSLLDIPDGLLVAAMVVAVKYLYPFDKTDRLPMDPNDPLTLRMDWATWGEVFARRGHARPARMDFEKMDPQKIWTMSKDDIEEYLTWYEKTRVDKNRPTYEETDIERMLFPLEGPRLRVNEIVNRDLFSEEQITARMKTVHSAIKYVEPSGTLGHDSDGDIPKGIGAQYPVFQKPEEVTGSAKLFYEKVAEISGLDFRDLVHAVSKLEMMLIEKQDEERRSTRNEIFQ